MNWNVGELAPINGKICVNCMHNQFRIVSHRPLEEGGNEYVVTCTRCSHECTHDRPGEPRKPAAATEKAA